MADSDDESGGDDERAEEAAGQGASDGDPAGATGDEDGVSFADAEETDVGDNIFGPSGDPEPVEPGRPEAENVFFVLVGILLGVLVIMRLVGAI